jgi:class 3 adenylate cyclase
LSLADDLRSEVKNIFVKKWDTRDGIVVPETDDISLGNVAVKLDGTILYSDLVESTAMVNNCKSHFAAEIYKSYLVTVCRIIKEQEGEITAFDGDRVMAIFIGNNKNTNAVKTALKINWAVAKIVNKELKEVYPDTNYWVKQAVGIDTSNLWIARTGIRGSNDLVWVGRAANYAAKLCSLRSDNKVTWITNDVYDSLNDEAKYSKGESIWEQHVWNDYNCHVYSSTYWCSID